MMRDEFPEVVVLTGDGNLFWTASINMGIRQALDLGAKFIFTLNNDTVASPTLLEKMMFWSGQRPHALLGSFDIDATTQIPYYGGEITNWKNDTATMLLDVVPKREQHGLHEVSLFPARGLLIPREVFDTIGLFEEKKLPHYMADYDFTLMAARHGFKIYCNYDAVLYTYPQEGGDHKIKRVKTLAGFWQHLFSIKGGGNLRNFTVYTFRNCPRRYIPMSLLVGYARRIAGFWF
jgi:GT2 family glycosyltransferase